MKIIKTISLVAVIISGATVAKAGALETYQSETEKNAHRVLEGSALDKTSRILGGSGSGSATTTNPTLSQVERTKTQVQSILNNQTTESKNSRMDAEHQNTRRELDKIKSVLNENKSSQNHSAGREETHATARSSNGTASSLKTGGGKAIHRGGTAVARRRSSH